MEIEQIYRDLPTLYTKRLVLRKVMITDVNDMYEYASDDEVSKYVTWDTHQSVVDTKEYINALLRKYDLMQVSPWAIEYKETGKMIGTIDFVSWQPNHRIAEIGYVISKKYWGSGLTTEATKEIIKFGFENMDLVRIQARCLTENIASARVMEKVGMTFEGVIRKGALIKEKHEDFKLYSILQEEFQSVD